MLAEHHLPNHLALNVAGRFLFTALFLLSGVVELAGALMILFNWRPRLGAWLLVLFLIPVTIAVHGYEMVNAETEVMRLMQQAHFIKGFSLVGAALLTTQLGVGHRAASR